MLSISKEDPLLLFESSILNPSPKIPDINVEVEKDLPSAIANVLPSNVRFSSAFIVSAPAAVNILLFNPLDMKSETSTLTVGVADSPELLAKSIPVPATKDDT